MSMRRTIGSVILTVALFRDLVRPRCADGGALRLSGKRGDYRIAVFTAPTPFRAGDVDVSVLVQEAATGVAMPDAVPVTVRMVKPGGPVLEYPATTEAATNKLFRAAQFELPEPGRWELRVRIEGPHGEAEIAGEVEAAGTLPRWPEIWPWIAWPAPAIVLFAIHQVLVRQRAGRAERLV